jgi:3-dehydroquinate synthase
VDTGARRYAVHVGRGVLDGLPALLTSLSPSDVLIVSSPRVWALHGRRVAPLLGRRRDPILVPDGESTKSRTWLARLHDALLDRGLDRKGLVLAIGGGVVGDLAGFAAATYMRGVDWVGVPTTLLSMVDSSIGGKVGINHPQAKNLLGAFHQPRAVVADTALLATLPPRQIQSGAYEIVKCGLLGDAALFRALQRDTVDVEAAVAAACRIKAEVVSKDEREGGLRRVLNLGHTLGHALEAVTGYRRFTHGEAVGWGLIGAAALSRQRGLLGPDEFTEVAEAVDRLGPRPPLSGLPPRDILDAAGRDKKGRGTFVLPVAIGRVAVHADVSRGEVLAVLKELARRPTGGSRASSSWPRGFAPAAASAGPSGRGGGSRPRRRRPTAGRR